METIWTNSPTEPRTRMRLTRLTLLEEDAAIVLLVLWTQVFGSCSAINCNRVCNAARLGHLFPVRTSQIITPPGAIFHRSSGSHGSPRSPEARLSEPGPKPFRLLEDLSQENPVRD